jgi:hypothetical protein
MKGYTNDRRRAGLWALTLLMLVSTASAGEKTSLRIEGKATDCEVSRVAPDGITMKTGGREQKVPLDKIDPRDVVVTYRLLTPPKDAALRFGMGQYFLKYQLLNEAEEELNAAASLDASYKAKAASLLAAVKAIREVTTKKDPGAGPSRVVIVGGDGDGEGEGEGNDFTKQFIKREVPARSDAEMKAFLDKRLGELKGLGGEWRMIETKHYYCFSAAPEVKHKNLCQWNEGLYDRLSQVLKHKEGDKLWNNKMCIYYFETYAQFKKFALDVDHSPTGQYSGGYFHASGREVHMCIPFISERFKNVKDCERVARNTLHHECTHAFLQISGEDVRLPRWLHEGLAQFIEFWYDRENNQDFRENNPARKHRVTLLQQAVQRGHMPSWSEMRDRPRIGTDIEGYSFAWSRLEFLYRNFDNQKLPQFIRALKAGKAEEEAFKTTFGYPMEKLEEVYRAWMKVQAKTNFKF